MIAGLRSRYFLHQNALEKSVETYKKELPKGMTASTDHVDMLLHIPHANTATVKKSLALTFFCPSRSSACGWFLRKRVFYFLTIPFFIIRQSRPVCLYFVP